MKSPDKFLIGIIMGVVVLLAIVFTAVLSRPAVKYQSEDTPEGVAHNYLLALQNEDYERAFSYLSPELRGYPETTIEFKRNVERDRFRFRHGSSISLAVQTSDMLGDGQAYVEVRERLSNSGGLFSSSQSTMDFEIFLVLEDGEWKIRDADYYFASCWINYQSCR